MVARCVFKDGSRIEKGSDDTAQTVRAELTPLFKDNVTEWLPLDSQCMFRFPLRLHQERSERTRVQRSYRNWLRYEGSRKGSSDHPHPNRNMHDLHRLYWAIRSNRPKLATVLMTRCAQPILAGIFSSFFYRNQLLPPDFVPDAKLKAKYKPKAMQRSSEEYACEILDCAELDGSNAAFDSFLYYGVDEEDGDDYRNFITKEQQQIENSNVRAALELMGVDPRTEVTHLDLALLANTKMFMAQAGVTQHLLKLWKRPSDNDNLVQRHLPALFQIPKVKGYLNLVGFAAFIAVYATLLINVPNRGDPQELTAVEGVFWIWTLGLILNEVMEAVGDFDAISDYVRASGNVTDMILISAFLSAFACRIVSSVDKANLYAVDWMLGLLCGNFILCCVRFLLMLSMVGEIGVVSPSPPVALRRQLNRASLHGNRWSSLWGRSLKLIFCPSWCSRRRPSWRLKRRHCSLRGYWSFPTRSAPSFGCSPASVSRSQGCLVGRLSHALPCARRAFQ